MSNSCMPHLSFKYVLEVGVVQVYPFKKLLGLKRDSPRSNISEFNNIDSILTFLLVSSVFDMSLRFLKLGEHSFICYRNKIDLLVITDLLG